MKLQIFIFWPWSTGDITLLDIVCSEKAAEKLITKHYNSFKNNYYCKELKNEKSSNA
jgi:hypothetical protein